MGCSEASRKWICTCSAYMYTLFTLRLIVKLSQNHADYLHYTSVTCALDYKWTGIMDMETLLFSIEDAVTGCKSILQFNKRRHAELR